MKRLRTMIALILSASLLLPSAPTAATPFPITRTWMFQTEAFSLAGLSAHQPINGRAPAFSNILALSPDAFLSSTYSAGPILMIVGVLVDESPHLAVATALVVLPSVLFVAWKVALLVLPPRLPAIRQGKVQANLDDGRSIFLEYDRIIKGSLSSLTINHWEEAVLQELAKTDRKASRLVYRIYQRYGLGNIQRKLIAYVVAEITRKDIGLVMLTHNVDYKINGSLQELFTPASRLLQMDAEELGLTLRSNTDKTLTLSLEELIRRWKTNDPDETSHRSVRLQA